MSDYKKISNKLINPDIDGGTIDGAVIGGTTPAAGSFTELSLNVLKPNHNTEILAADKILLTTDYAVQWLDPGGVDRDVTLPAEASSTNQLFIILNTANGAGENLIVKDDTPTTIATLGAGMAGVFSCDGTLWQQENENGIFYDKVNDRIGINVTDPDTLLQIANNNWFSGKNYAGTDAINMLKVNVDDEIEVGGTLVLGAAIEAAEDSGAVTLVDMPVSATPAAATEESFTLKIDGDNILKVYAEADSAGSIQNKKVIVECGVNLKEITTPTAKADYGAIYTKTDNKLYFQDGAGVETEVSVGCKAYGEGWFYNNSTVLTVETVDIPIGMHGVTEGECCNMTFDIGSAGATSAFADGTGGTVLVTSNGHGLSNGAIITIMGSTSYNGVFEISAVTTNTFKITDTWVADDGIATWIEPSSAVVSTAGIYFCNAHISCFVNGVCTLKWIVYKNATMVTKLVAERKFPNNDMGTNAMAAFVDLAAGDKVWMSVQSTSLVGITSKHGGMLFHKL